MDFPLIATDPTPLEGRKHPPVDSSKTSIAALGSQATVTVAAGGTGVRHVAGQATFSVAMTANVAATTVAIAIIDGASGGTTAIWQAVLVVAGTAGVSFSTPYLHAFGSANTAMTAEFSAGIGSATQCVSLHWHDIGVGAG